MAKKFYDKKIDKTTDWGGDESTNNLPVSGKRVQEFIKNALENKMGTIHYDDSNNRYLVFADEENRDLYLADPIAGAQYVMGTFDAPANYFAEITMTTPLSQSIQKGEKGNFIEFTFDVKNKAGTSIGESVQCTFTINGANGKKVVRENYSPLTSVKFLVDDYLSTGINNITVSIIGTTTLAATTSGVTINVIELDYVPAFGFQTAVAPSGTLAIPYTINGAGVKYIEYYIDGVLHGTADTITDVSANRTKYIELTALESGLHTLQTRAYVVSNGQNFYTKTTYWDFAVTGGSSILIMVGTIISTPITTDLEISGEQYRQISFDWAIYDPQANNRTVTFTLGEEVISTVEASNNVSRTFSYFPTTYGQRTLVISCSTATKSIDIYTSQSPIGIQEAVEGRILRLSAVGRSNAEVDKDTWTNNGYQTTFNGFSWNDNQGWSNGALVLSGGANIEIDIRPLATNYAQQGGTIEIEFETTFVEDEEAVICECLDDTTGAGIIIKATSATVQSSGGAKVTTRFNVGDRLKLAFIVNKTTGTEFAQLALIASNGMLERATNYNPTDSFVCNETLKIGDQTGKTSLRLYSIRVYDRALTAEEEFGNYVLDSNNIDAVVNKNDVYVDGTTTLSVDKIAGKIPVMIITADLDTLMASMDKSLSVYGDIQYINNQDPTKSFTTQGSRIRLQGTSSLGYPRKNYRFYTALGKYGTMLDYQGNQLPEGKYSFKDGATPVDLWCLKADYAESSMSHNTGVARLWNDLIRDVQVDGQFRCRTQAQQTAISGGYPYDVRTAIDGFPIVLFYRQTYNDELICLGQYCFNNDKRNEEVFGFKDIPGFDNSQVECWEFLNNTHPLTTFTSPENFDEQWEEAFEARYPDEGSDADTTHLKDFAMWCSTTSREDGAIIGETITIAAEVKSDTDTQYADVLKTYAPNGVYPDTPENRMLKFEKEKWDYLDVYKVAAYYVYLMRFGAVDQVVKNAMLTTEGTQGVGTHKKWYFINYDNDTVMGVRNDARLMYDYNIDRQTLDETLDGVYAYMGYDSTLWNNLEADEEFMRVVRAVDAALYDAGMTYENVVDMFDNKQSGQWGERLYNENSKYKYIQPFYEDGTNNLFMLQGRRMSHRHWWLKNRFDVYDAKWVSGAYKSRVIEFKAPNASTTFSIVAGKKLEYGYGINNDPMEANVSLEAGDSHTFTLPRTLAIGDPVRVYAATSVRALDLSPFKTQLAQFNMQQAYDPEFGSYFKKLVLGDGNPTQNTALTDISGLSSVITMEYLDIRGFSGITSLNLKTLVNLKTFLSEESGLTAFSPASGTKFDAISLPTSIQTITMEDMDIQSFTYTPTINLREVALKNVSGFTSNTFIQAWYNTLASSGNPSLLQNAKLTLEGIHWEGLTVQQLKNLSYFGTWSIKGYVKLVSLFEEEMDELITIYGSEAFQSGGEFRIDAPPSMYIAGVPQLKSGETTQFTATVFPLDMQEDVIFSIVGGVQSNENGRQIFTLGGSKLYSDTGELVTERIYAADQTLSIKATLIGEETVEATKTVIVKKRTFPTAVNIEGAEILAGTGSLHFDLSYVGEYDVDVVSTSWTLTPETTAAQLSNKTHSGCDLLVNVPSDTFLTLAVTVTFENNIVRTDSKTIELKLREPVVIMTSDTNAPVLAICYAQGWCASPDSMTDIEASMVTSIGSAFSKSAANTDIKSFDEFQYFTGVTSLASGAFQNNIGMTSITIPDGVTSLGEYCFYECRALASVNIPDSVTSIGRECFENCSALISITVPDGVTSLPFGCFKMCSALAYVNIPDSVTTLGDDCFYACAITSIDIPASVYSLGSRCFAFCRTLASIYCRRSSAPVASSDAFRHTGIDTASLRINMIYVPQGATGYDAGLWLTQLQNTYGYTISYTL